MMRAGLALLLLWTVGAVAQERLMVSDAWVRAAPQGQPVLAGYLQLQNVGSEPLRVTALSSAQFEAVELHQTLIEQGVARMLKLPELVIDAHGSVALQPGGMHLMLIRPTESLGPGDCVEVTFQYLDGTEQAVRLEIRHAPDAPSAHHHHLNH